MHRSVLPDLSSSQYNLKVWKYSVPVAPQRSSSKIPTRADSAGKAPPVPDRPQLDRPPPIPERPQSSQLNFLDEDGDDIEIEDMSGSPPN